MSQRIAIPCMTVSSDRTTFYNYYPDRVRKSIESKSINPINSVISNTETEYFHPDDIPKNIDSQALVNAMKEKRADNRSFNRLRDAMYFLMITSPFNKTYCKIEKKHFTFRLNFITLTLSEKQKHDDYFIKSNMLDPFLKWMKRKGAQNYVWRAETQANGNIHFHISSNTYIHYRSIRDKWNQLQSRYGYLDSYFDAHLHCDANSTDVHAVKNEGKAIRYVAKYMGKQQPDRRQIDGHAFGYSQALSHPKFVFSAHEDAYRVVGEFIKTRTLTTRTLDYIKLYYTHPLYDYWKCPPLKDAVDKQLAKSRLRQDSQDDLDGD